MCLMPEPWLVKLWWAEWQSAGKVLGKVWQLRNTQHLPSGSLLWGGGLNCPDRTWQLWQLSIHEQLISTFYLLQVPLKSPRLSSSFTSLLDKDDFVSIWHLYCECYPFRWFFTVSNTSVLTSNRTPILLLLVKKYCQVPPSLIEMLLPKVTSSWKEGKAGAGASDGIKEWLCWLWTTSCCVCVFICFVRKMNLEWVSHSI